MAELADIETAGPSRTRPSNSPTTPANLASGTPGPRAAGSPSPAGPSGYGSGVRRGTDSDTAHWQWLALASAGRAVLLHHAGRDARPSPPAGASCLPNAAAFFLRHLHLPTSMLLAPYRGQCPPPPSTPPLRSVTHANRRRRASGRRYARLFARSSGEDPTIFFRQHYERIRSLPLQTDPTALPIPHPRMPERRSDKLVARNETAHRLHA